jgi:hypothetical protein
MEIACESEEEASIILRLSDELERTYREYDLEKAMIINRNKIMKWCVFGMVNRIQANKLVIVNMAYMLQAKENPPI